jgi:hypothetical protein
MSEHLKIDLFVLYKLKSRLHYLETQKPIVYEAIDDEGKLVCSFSYTKWVEQFEAEGYIVRQADIEEEIGRLKLSVMNHIRTHK